MQQPDLLLYAPFERSGSDWFLPLHIPLHLKSIRSMVFLLFIFPRVKRGFIEWCDRHEKVPSGMTIGLLEAHRFGDEHTKSQGSCDQWVTL